MSKPQPGTPGHYANQIFRRRRLSTGELRGSENYYAAVDGLPTWVTARLPHRRDVVGVYENLRGTPSQALILCEDRLLVVNKEGTEVVETVHYSDVVDWLWFRKEPVARQLAIVLKNGVEVCVPIFAEEGAVSLLASFIGGAAHRSRAVVRE